MLERRSLDELIRHLPSLYRDFYDIAVKTGRTEEERHEFAKAMTEGFIDNEVIPLLPKKQP